VSTKTEKLAALLLSDRDRPPSPRHNIVPCFSCGYTFVYRGRNGDLNGRFCSLRCREWFDQGNPSYEQQQEYERKLLAAPLDSFRVVAAAGAVSPGPPGVEVGSQAYPWAESPSPTLRRGTEGYYIACRHCNKEFESKGLRCCSKECESAYLESQERRAVLKKAGIEREAKRMCEGPGCERRIPKWKNGCLVSSKVRFCAALCRKRANRSSELESESTKPGTS
jgi:hypothetical protein